uniref:Hypotheticial protein n=2 Tax=Schistosoma japonicum TaxID=6182 RepID=C1LGD9_SCHJA|nr:hypotheticial protein [Schistosoma japonicum]
MVSRVNPKTKVLSSYDIFLKALKTESVFNDKNDFLDIIYWFRQVFAIIIGVVWGLASFTGFLAIVMFFVTNICFVYAYAAMYQRVDEDEYGGYGEIVKEGLMTAFACFMVSWILTYDCAHGISTTTW